MGPAKRMKLLYKLEESFSIVAYPNATLTFSRLFTTIRSSNPVVKCPKPIMFDWRSAIRVTWNSLSPKSPAGFNKYRYRTTIPQVFRSNSAILWCP